MTALLDPETTALVASAVVVVTAVSYLVTAFVRRDNSGARLWAFAYLLTTLGVVAYFVWRVGEPGSWGAVGALAMAQAVTVGATGCFALGFRAYTSRTIEGPAFIVTALSLLCGAASVVEAAAGGDSDQPWTFLAVGVLWLWTAFSAVQGRLRTSALARVLAVAAAMEGLFSAGRFVVHVTLGADSTLYRDWFSATMNNVLYVTVGLVFTLGIFVLRSTLAGGARMQADNRIDEVLPFPLFRAQLVALLRRSTERMETVAVIAARIDSIAAISSAFGGDFSEDMTRALRRSVRRFASPIALVGDGEAPTVMYIATLASSQADARRQAGLLYRGVVRSFIAGRDVVQPDIGVGVALSQTLGYDADVLLEGARAAAVEASGNEEASVGFAALRDLTVDPFPADAS